MLIGGDRDGARDIPIFNVRKLEKRGTVVIDPFNGFHAGVFLAVYGSHEGP